MNRIRRFLGAELEDVDDLVEERIFSINYQDQELEFYSYNPSTIQKAADFLHLEPAPDYVVEVTEGSKTSYFEATRRDIMDVLQQPRSEFKK